MAATAQDVDTSDSILQTDEKPLALRKTPRLVVGQNLYRGSPNQSQMPAKLKENSETPTLTTKKTSQSSDSKTETSTDGNKGKKRASDQNNASAGKRKKSNAKDMERKHDSYCWACHKEGVLVGCEVCPRAYHTKCASLDKDTVRDWVCAECDLILKAENVDLRSNAMRALSVDQLCNLLKFAVSRMRMQCPEEFVKPVPLDVFPNYYNFVVHPMDLETLEKNIKQRMYGCTESFIADTKWILHNCIIFNGYQHKLTSIAKALLKICKHEMSEIEVCPDCYSNAYTKRENWFQEPCCPPHLLIWAKLKGFPFWPAKAMRVVTGSVDVRFFGAHDRAWIPVSQCFLLSSDIPTALKIKKKGVFENSMEELAQHIKKVKERFQVFQYASFRSPLVAQDLNIHIQSMLPGVNLKDYCRSSVGTFRYQGTMRQSTSSDSSPFLPKDCPSLGFMAQSKSIKQELLSPFAAPAKEASKQTSEGVKPDCVRVLKPRLECMKKLEVAIEKIKSFGKDFDFGFNKNPSDEASTSKPSNSQEASKGAAENDGKDKELSLICGVDETTPALDIIDPDGEHKLDTNQSDSLTSTDACEVSSTTCVPEVIGCAEECVSTSPSTSNLIVPITALESLESFVETKLPADVCATESANATLPQSEYTETIVPIKEDANFESKDEAKLPTVELDSAPEQNNTPGIDIGLDDQLMLSPESGMEETMEISEEDTSKTGSINSVLHSNDKLSELVDQESLPVEEKGESPKSNKLEELSELNPDSNQESSSVEMESDHTDDKHQEAADSDISNKAKKNLAKSDANSDETDEVKIDESEPTTANITESNENLRESRMELGSAVLSEEGDLVIDLDRDREEEALNSSKSKKRNSRSPFGGIKLKEKTPPKDKKQHAMVPKTKSKPNQPLDKPAVDLGCSAVSSGNTIRVSTNLPMLSCLGLRSSVSVLQAQQSSRSMPVLHPRPTMSLASPGSGSSSSSTCHPSPGSNSGLNKYSQKMVDFVRGTMEEMFHDLAKTGNPEATIKTLQLEMEKMQWHHQQEIAEMKHNTDLILLEMRSSMESEKHRIATEVRRQCEMEKQKAVAETKKKQWCAYCGKEAIFYCCWNTSYCDYPCQQSHWPRHVNECSQTHAVCDQGSKDSPADNGSSRNQNRKNSKNSKKSEQASEPHQQMMIGHPHMQGNGSMTSALTSLQVIPQNSIRGGPSLQVQYIGSSPQTSALPTITMQAPTVTAQFATVASHSGYPVPQGMSGGPQGAMFQQRPMQVIDNF